MANLWHTLSLVLAQFYTAFGCLNNKDFIIAAGLEDTDLLTRAQTILQNGSCYSDNQLFQFLDCYRYCNSASPSCVAFAFVNQRCAICNDNITGGDGLSQQFQGLVFFWRSYLLNMYTQDVSTSGCMSSPCGGGDCMTDGNSYNCHCYAGYGGDHCEIDLCETVNCENGGMIVAAEGSCHCECTSGFTGANCESGTAIGIVDACAEVPCQHQGMCMNTPTATHTFSCTCPHGYTGTLCETDINECWSSPCLNDGTCGDSQAAYICECVDGFGDTSCSTDYCALVTCVNHGTVTAVSGGCVCACLGGFSGDSCQIDNGPSYDEANPLAVTNGYYAGDWGYVEACPTGSFATGVRLSVDDSTMSDGWGVDTVQLSCKHVVTMEFVDHITSTGLRWGEWKNEVLCSDDSFITRFRMFNEPGQGDGDDSATNNLEVECRGPGLTGTSIYDLKAEGAAEAGALWGMWSLDCPPGQAVNALQVRFEADQGFFGDDSAIGDVKMFCSNY